MSADAMSTLVRMANQIAIAFRQEPPEKAAADTAEHIRLYWTGKMRADLLAHMAAGGGGLDAAAAQAMRSLPPPKTRV